jgi:hypothetical protein
MIWKINHVVEPDQVVAGPRLRLHHCWIRLVTVSRSLQQLGRGLALPSRCARPTAVRRGGRRSADIFRSCRSTSRRFEEFSFYRRTKLLRSGRFQRSRTRRVRVTISGQSLESPKVPPEAGRTCKKIELRHQRMCDGLALAEGKSRELAGAFGLPGNAG